MVLCKECFKWDKITENTYRNSMSQFVFRFNGCFDTNIHSRKKSVSNTRNIANYASKRLLNKSHQTLSLTLTCEYSCPGHKHNNFNAMVSILNGISFQLENAFSHLACLAIFGRFRSLNTKTKIEQATEI